jgi:hypothetical protein
MSYALTTDADFVEAEPPDDWDVLLAEATGAAETLTRAVAATLE